MELGPGSPISINRLELNGPSRMPVIPIRAVRCGQSRRSDERVIRIRLADSAHSRLRKARQATANEASVQCSRGIPVWCLPPERTYVAR
jgi:hypothetical protein